MRWFGFGWSLPVVAVLVATASCPHALNGQKVEGRLLDAAASFPVSSARIHLLRGEQGDTIGVIGVTDTQGHFLIAAPRSGRYRLRFLRIGYETVTTPPFDLLAGEAPLDVEVRISAAAVLLAPLTIVSPRVPFVADPRLQFTGYYDRRGAWGREGRGTGFFLEHDAIVETNPSRVSDVMRTVPGVRVRAAGGRRQVITMTGGCRPVIFVDGIPTPSGEDIDDLVVPSSLVGVEIYTGFGKPIQFMSARDPGLCGAIALWTGYSPPRRNRPDVPRAPEHTSLHLTLSADSASLSDSVRATLTISNFSADSTSWCITDSRYSLRGPQTTRDIVETLPHDPCPYRVDLRPGERYSWQELLAFTSTTQQPDVILIQKHFGLRSVRCSDGAECQVALSSEPRRLVLYRSTGRR